MISHTPSSRPMPRLFQPSRRRGVLTQFAGMLGLRPAQAMWLGSSRDMASQGGIAWRLEFDAEPVQSRSRPCVRLPLSTSQLGCEALLRLLAEQARLLAERSLYLRVSPEGCVELTTVQWFDRASELLDMLERTMSEVPNLLQALQGSGDGVAWPSRAAAAWE